jgi:hypothetical protein
MTDAAALRNAPVDDEPETEEERQAVAEAASLSLDYRMTDLAAGSGWPSVVRMPLPGSSGLCGLNAVWKSVTDR